jgi:hypothetical protein
LLNRLGRDRHAAKLQLSRLPLINQRRAATRPAHPFPQQSTRLAPTMI